MVRGALFYRVVFGLRRRRSGVGDLGENLGKEAVALSLLLVLFLCHSERIPKRKREILLLPSLR